MKAQTLSLCVPSIKCDKACPYCVSRMTWAPSADPVSWGKNLHKVAHFARMAQVTDVIITGKGEPSLSEHTLRAASEFKDWPIVVQTNGQQWSQMPELLNEYRINGEFLFNVISVSIDSPYLVQSYAPLWKKISQSPPMTARITVMLTPEVCSMDLDWWVMQCVRHAIRGLSFREITVPTDHQQTKASKDIVEWIIRTNEHLSIKNWKQNFDRDFGTTDSSFDTRVIRRLPYGAVIKDIEGISVTKFDYCIQDRNGQDDIRSLIYNQDGHLYTTWSSPASIIF